MTLSWTPEFGFCRGRVSREERLDVRDFWAITDIVLVQMKKVRVDREAFEVIRAVWNASAVRSIDLFFFGPGYPYWVIEKRPDNPRDKPPEEG